jgi:hypothetical protein
MEAADVALRLRAVEVADAEAAIAASATTASDAASAVAPRPDKASEPTAGPTNSVDDSATTCITTGDLEVEQKARDKQRCDEKMKKLFRKDVERPSAQFAATFPIGGLVSVARPLSAWATFIKVGYTSDEMYVTERGDTQATLPPASHPSDRARVKTWLDSMPITMLMDDAEAARAMIGLGDGTNNFIEKVTLMENGSSAIDWNHNQRPAGEDSLADDETMLMLDRMRDLSTKVLHLETQVRERYRRDRELVSRGPAVLTVGEGRLVRELKVANDNLRWKLQQRQRALLAAQEALSVMRSQSEEAELRARDSETMVARLKKQLKKLEAGNYGNENGGVGGGSGGGGNSGSGGSGSVSDSRV